MKGIVLAGGKGTRLYPLTHVTNKHLLPVYDKPMVYYPLETLKRAGINDVMIVVGGPYAGHFLRVLKNGEDLGMNIQYAYQEGSGGIAHALSLTEEFAAGDDVCVILGDNTTDADISKEVSEFKEGAHLFLQVVPDPERFGVPTINDGKITLITEKPKRPASTYAVTGLYLFDRDCFKLIKTLSPSERGELEVTDLNNIYLKANKLQWSPLQGYWRDCGTAKTLFEAGQYWRSKEDE